MLGGLTDGAEPRLEAVGLALPDGAALGELGVGEQAVVKQGLELIASVVDAGDEDAGVRADVVVLARPDTELAAGAVPLLEAVGRVGSQKQPRERRAPPPSAPMLSSSR
ncbi:hypothetical protein [Aeromicrobium sp. CF3.5]|uniref:hypothetical protein n=1 Tax=Aeromicrobium sp. CF3.5 TaxID=3373078 RepID=UPI003EE4F0A6